MRIANKILTSRFAYNVNNTLDLINKYNSQIATGRKVDKPSDAPENISLILQFKRGLANIEQYGKNIDAGLSFLRATNNALIASVEQGRSARKLAVNAANDPTLFSDTAITGLITDISGMKEEIRSQANTQLSGKYIFSGYSTKTAAYNASSNGYNGDTFYINAKISDNNVVPINVTGDVAFRESVVTGTLEDNSSDPVGGVTEVNFDNNIITAAGELTTSVIAPGAYTGSSTGKYRVVVNNANTTAGEVGGLVLDLQFSNGTVDGFGNLVYATVDTVAAVGGVAATETITLTDNGLSFGVDVDLLNATSRVSLNDNGNLTANTGTIDLNRTNPYTGPSDLNEFYVQIVTSNVAAGDLTGMQVQLMRNGIAAGAVINVPAGAGPNNVVLGTVNGVDFDADITAGAALQFNAGERSDGYTYNLGAAGSLNSFDVTGDVNFTVSDGTNTSAAIVFTAGTTYTTTQVEAIVNAAIAAGTPQAPTISFDYNADGEPTFSIDPRDSTGVMELDDLSAGSNLSTQSRLQDMFNITEGYKNIFGVLDDLNAAIIAKSSDDLQVVIGRLDNVEGEMLKSTGVVGAVERSLGNNKDFLEKVKDEKVTLLSSLEDADPTESITKLTNQQTAYDAILYYGSLIQRRSLLDFLM